MINLLISTLLISLLLLISSTPSPTSSPSIPTTLSTAVYRINQQETARNALRGTDGCKPVRTQDGFDLNSFISSRWYIQEQSPTSYLPVSQNYCVYAEYSLLKNNFFGWDIQVYNYAEEVDGTVQDSGNTLCANKSDENDPAKLEVGPCFLPTFAAGPYWVLEYDEDEGSALISGGQPNINTGKGCKNGDGVNGSGLWIFTRRRERDDDVINDMRRKAEVQGFDLSVLNVVDQTDCGKNRRLVTSTSPPPTTSPTATSPPTPRPTPSCDAELTNLSDCLNDGIEDGTCIPVVRDTGGCLIGEKIHCSTLIA
ncbi:hypothetical protein TL16_g12768 [Triparma laevis f. inornata]|uniref:Uncharacterized protein n=2 Tax=Triparma laevis TaxID=1534972 RepID=A0A9W7F8L5_9STRA|nr:hypothetical protein TL16_g12768 [Triparma laevis f. inornata]GMI07314.1 hypothetical protein TrLO_g7520 [Triparma laevis f. longispina]